jgi:predicted nuclease of predicted toxin-antitoxin system
MKILLDENLPKRLKKDFKNHIVFTVRDMDWQGTKNGMLLNLMINKGFEVFITFDKNLKFQQNFEKYPIPVVVLNAKDNTYQTLFQFTEQILNLLDSELKPGAILLNTPSIL